MIYLKIFNQIQPYGYIEVLINIAQNVLSFFKKIRSRTVEFNWTN